MTGPRLSEAEIKRLWAEYQAQQEQPDPYKPTTPRIASDSPRVTQVSAPKGYAGDYVGGVARQAAQGATFGFADEAEAGLRSGFGPRTYRDVRDEIRGKNDKFASENPGAALAANLVGGVASGAGLAGVAKALPRIGAGMRTLGLAPKAEATMTAAQRIGNGMKMGTAAGVVSGAGAAKEMADAPIGMLAGGLVGGTAGVMFGAAAEGMRGARNLVSRVGQGQGAPGAIRRAIRADSPEQSAAKRTLALLGQQNMSVDDLAARSATADAPDILGEVIGQRGIRTTSSANRLGYEAPDFIGEGLTRRGRDEVDRVRTAWRDAAGDPVDDVAFAEAKRGEALNASGKLYGEANKLPPVTNDDIGQVVETLDKMPQFGPRALKRAETLAVSRGDTFPESFKTTATPDKPSLVLGADGAPASIIPGAPSKTTPVSVRNVFDLRRGIDEVVNEMQAAGDSPAIAAELLDMRARIDAIAKGAGEASGDVVRLADEAFSVPMQEREAFALGQTKGRSMQPVDAARMGQGPHVDYTRKGVANTIHEDLAKLQDGAAGQIRNPAPLVMGNDQVDARVAFALNDDAERIGRVQSTAQNASRRLKNKNDILGGSQTAQRLADDAGQGLNPSDVLAAASNPFNAALRAVGKGANALRRNVVGQDMDATARLLMAGAPGAMTREQAIAMLRRMEPAIRAQLERQLIARGAMGGAAGGAAAR